MPGRQGGERRLLEPRIARPRPIVSRQQRHHESAQDFILVADVIHSGLHMFLSNPWPATIVRAACFPIVSRRAKECFDCFKQG
jgi:hypothetical protein